MVYVGIPVSFAWASSSLHAYIDVLFGVFVLRIALRAHPGVALAATLAMGVAWGLWGSWPWPETRITDAEFAKLAAVSAFLLTLGLWLSDRVPPSTGVHPWVGWAVLLISLGLGVLQLLPFLPYGLALVPLVALTGWALVRGREGDGPLLDETPPPVWRYGLPSLSAVLAWVTYTTISAAEMGLPSNEVIPAILVLTVVGYLWVLVRALLGR